MGAARRGHVAAIVVALCSARPTDRGLCAITAAAAAAWCSPTWWQWWCAQHQHAQSSAPTQPARDSSSYPQVGLPSAFTPPCKHTRTRAPPASPSPTQAKDEWRSQYLDYKGLKDLIKESARWVVSFRGLKSMSNSGGGCVCLVSPSWAVRTRDSHSRYLLCCSCSCCCLLHHRRHDRPNRTTACHTRRQAETSGPAAFSPRTTSLSIVRAAKTADAAEERFFQMLEAEVRVGWVCFESEGG